MMKDYSKTYLYVVCILCEGATVMLENKSGVMKLMKDKFPSLIVWHRSNDILELSVSDTVTAVLGIGRFETFIDNLYIVHNALPKSSGELKVCVNLLEMKIG
jgi:hypothetical protein